MEYYNYLKSPELVASVQKYFGVKILDEGNFLSDDPGSNTNNLYTNTTNKSNGTTRHVQYSDNNFKQTKLKENSTNKKPYEITNKFWYHLFVFGTALGDEVFYSCFIPFWFWNVDGAVGRRVVLVWTIVMYVGQSIKDVLCWPRPGPPVIRLQNKWSLEYGMPSTHAMVGVSIPFSVVFYTMNRYDYNFSIGFTIAVVWCTLICVSRIYLGMHTVLDIIAGLLLAILIMFPLVPLVDYMDNFFLTSPTGPFLLFIASILLIVYYPISVKWTPTRGDTTMVLSVCVGVHIGAWLNWQTGIMTHPDLPQPYTIFWPSFSMLCRTVLRTILGFSFVALTQIFGKKVFYNFLCALVRENVEHIKKSENSIKNKQKTFVELGTKYFICVAIGFNTLYCLPHLFRYMHIERPTFYTEI